MPIHYGMKDKIPGIEISSHLSRAETLFYIYCFKYLCNYLISKYMDYSKIIFQAQFP